MRLFRRSLALFLSLLMLFALVSCEAKPEQEDSLGESSFAESLTSREENKPSDTESSLPAETDEPSDEGSDVSEEVSDPLDEESDTSDEESDTSEEESDTSEEESDVSEEEDDVSLPEVSHDPAVLQAYEEAFEAFRDADSFSLTLSVSTEKYVGIALITETTNATAKFAGLHTDTPTAQIITKYANVSVESAGFTATECHQNGSSLYYIEGENYTYQAEESFEQFMERQIPYRVFDPKRYGVMESSGGRILFSDANAPEFWVPYITEDYSEFSFSAEGWLQIAKNSDVEMEYSATFIQGAASYTMTYRITLSLESIDPNTLHTSIEGETISVTDFSLPYMLRYAAIHLDQFTVGRTVMSDHLHNHDGETRDEELAVNTCPDENGSLAMFCSHYHNRSTFNAPTVSYSAYFNGQGFSISETGEISPSFGSMFKHYLEHNHAASIPVPQYGEFKNLTVKDLGDFLLLEGDLVTQYAAAGLVTLRDKFDLSDHVIQTASVKTVKCRVSLDKDTGYLTAMYYVMEATLDHWLVKGDISMERYVYTEVGDLSAYHALFGTFAADPQLPEEEKPAPLFYKVTDGKGNEAYLLGTIHVGDGLTAALPDSIYSALKSADAMAVEMDLLAFESALEENPELDNIYQNSYYFSDGTDLRTYLGNEELYQRTADLMFAMGYGAQTDTMKPAAIASIMDSWYLDSINLISSEQGVDMRLLTLAYEQDKKIYEIEDIKEHLSAISDYSKETQIYLLKSSLEAGRYESYMSNGYLYQLWCGGDEELLKEAVSAPLPEDATPEEKAYYEEYTDKMITRRDKIMVDGSKAYLSSGETVFVAVGLAHVIGEGGIIDQLKEAGYTVTLVQ